MPIDAQGCTRGPHVFIEKTPEELHTRAAFIRSEDLRHPEGANPLKIAALDCELIRTTAGMALARLTIVDEDGAKVFDEFIKPNGMIVDLVTRWSGVTQEDLDERARTSFAKLHKDILGKYIDEKTSKGSCSCIAILVIMAEERLYLVLIGHGLENDLKAIRLVHPAGRVIDTAQLYPHSKGLPYRRALRFLVQENLGTCEWSIRCYPEHWYAKSDSPLPRCSHTRRWCHWPLLPGRCASRLGFSQSQSSKVGRSWEAVVCRVLDLVEA